MNPFSLNEEGADRLRGVIEWYRSLGLHSHAVRLIYQYGWMLTAGKW